MQTYILQYTDAEGELIRFEIEACSDLAAYNKAASKLWSLPEEASLHASLTCINGRMIHSAGEDWFPQPNF